MYSSACGHKRKDILGVFIPYFERIGAERPAVVLFSRIPITGCHSVNTTDGRVTKLHPYWPGTRCRSYCQVHTFSTFIYSGHTQPRDHTTGDQRLSVFARRLGCMQIRYDAEMCIKNCTSASERSRINCTTTTVSNQNRPRPQATVAHKRLVSG